MFSKKEGKLKRENKLDGKKEIHKKKKELIYPDLRSRACVPFDIPLALTWVFVVFVNIHCALVLRLLEVQRKREANGARPLIMRGILKSRQLVENLRLSFELLSYAFHKMTVEQKDRRKLH